MPKKRKPQGKINHDIVIQGLLAGKKKKDIAPEAGSIAKDDTAKINAVNRATNSDEYKKKVKPYVEQLKEQRQRAIDAIGKKNLDKEKFKDLSSALDSYTKNIQLLSGEDTEKSNITVTWE